MGISSPVLILKEPPAVTSAYEVLEPSDWVGREMPILEHIDIGEQLKEGNWLVVLYHHDCPACTEAIPQIEQMAQELEGNEDFLRLALVEVPPYGDEKNISREDIEMGKLDDCKDWFVTTPAIVHVENEEVTRFWGDNFPLLKEILNTRVEKTDACDENHISTEGR